MSAAGAFFQRRQRHHRRTGHSLARKKAPARLVVSRSKVGGRICTSLVGDYG